MSSNVDTGNFEVLTRSTCEFQHLVNFRIVFVKSESVCIESAVASSVRGERAEVRATGRD